MSDRPEPEPDDDDPFDLGPENKDSEGCLWPLFVVGFCLLVFIGTKLGLGWFVLLPGLLFVGLIGWFVVGHFSAKNLKELATLPSALLMLYGIVAFGGSVGAEYIVPELWAWPLSEETTVLVLPDGRRVAGTENGGRLQVYDADGNYLSGWFIPAHGGHYEILGPDLSLGENTILVYAVRAAKELILYDPEGRVLREEPAPEHFRAKPRGDFETMSFQTPWYLWPLVSPHRGWVVFGAGLLSMGAIQFLVWRGQSKGGGEGDEDDQPSAWIPEVSRRTILICLGIMLAGVVGLALAWRRFDLSLEILATLFFVLVWAVIFGTCTVTHWNSTRPTGRAPRDARSAARPPWRPRG